MIKEMFGKNIPASFKIKSIVAILVGITLWLSPLYLIGCKKLEDAERDEPKKYKTSDGGRSYIEFEIDGCQYLRRKNEVIFVHKGNCTNPFHERRSE